MSLNLFNMGHILWDKIFISYVYLNKILILHFLSSVLIFFRTYNCAFHAILYTFNYKNSAFYSEGDASKSLDNNPVKGGGKFAWMMFISR